MMEIKDRVTMLDFKDMTLTESIQAHPNEKIEEEFLGTRIKRKIYI